jgi:hypothetical protein
MEAQNQGKLSDGHLFQGFSPLLAFLAVKFVFVVKSLWPCKFLKAPHEGASAQQILVIFMLCFFLTIASILAGQMGWIKVQGEVDARVISGGGEATVSTSHIWSQDAREDLMRNATVRLTWNIEGSRQI